MLALIATARSEVLIPRNSQRLLRGPGFMGLGWGGFPPLGRIPACRVPSVVSRSLDFSAWLAGFGFVFGFGSARLIAFIWLHLVSFGWLRGSLASGARSRRRRRPSAAYAQKRVPAVRGIS